MNRPRVFVTRHLPGTAVERLALEADVEVWPGADPPPAADFLAAAQRSDGLLTLITDRVDDAFLEAAPSVQVVSQMAVGYDNIDVEACSRRGVLVCNTPGVLTEAVADLTFALLLSQARRLPEGERSVRGGEWGLWSPTYLMGRDLFGKTLGILGLGAIGMAVARRARGFGMRLIYNSRRRKPEAEEELGIAWRDFDAVLRESDYLSLNMALTPETKGIIGARELSLMKQGAVLVNSARGGLVDQDALVEALRSGHLGGAALDVFTVEPISPQDPLLQFDNVSVAPHIGSATVETRSRMADLAVDNLLAFFHGERPPCCVNPEVLAS